MLAADGLLFIVSGPLVHGLHGNIEAAGGSLGLRLFAPPILAVIGFGVGLSVPSDCAFGCPGNAPWGAYAGLLAGMALPMILDATVFGWKEARPRRRSDAAWALAPYPSQGGGGVSFVAGF